MNSVMRIVRPLLGSAIVVALVASTGCHWFRNSDYQRSAEHRPLEVPPDMDQPSTDNQLPLPAEGGTGSAAPSAIGFVVADSVENVWTRLGPALAGIEGVTINGQAESLRSVDVSFQGQSFLVRLENTAGQTRVSALSPSGQVLRAGPASILLDQLRSKL